MISDINILENIVKDLIEESIDENEGNAVALAKVYIYRLENVISDSTDWPIFNALLNQYITDELTNFSRLTFGSIYSVILQYFQDKLGGVQAVQLKNVNTISSIFNEENIVTEKVWGVMIKDDQLYQGPPVDTKAIITEFKGVDDATYMLGQKTFPEGEKTDDTIEETPSGDPKERTSEHTITAVFNITSKLNDMGHLVMRGSTCPVCGKHVDFIPSNGFCSLQCAGLYLINKAKETLTGEYREVDERIQKKIELVKNILDYINLTLNVFAKIPDVLAGIVRLPEEYKRYATQKINIIFLELKQIINKLLILKNNIIIQLLKRIKFGTLDNTVQQILPAINTLIQLANALKQQLTMALNAAYQAIMKASGFFYIGPQEYGFFMTIKSYQAICPFYKTDTTTYPPEQLGRPYWGPTVFNIAFDMSKCQLTIDIGAKSALQNRDFKKINSIIKKIFRPITEVEYLMDPDLFDVRLALSDQNATSIQKLINILQKVVVLGGDFIPSYENLKLSNIWYIIAILTCWGPWTRSIYGDYIFHGTI